MNKKKKTNNKNTKRILKIRPHWLKMIMQGSKRLEIRSRPCPHQNSWVTLAEVGSRRILCRALLALSRKMTTYEMKENAEALRELAYSTHWAWPIGEIQDLPQPIVIPGPVAQGSVQWITRERWEAFGAKHGELAEPHVTQASSSRP